MKIVILDGHTLNPGDLSWDGFLRLGDCTVYPRTSADQIIQRIGDAEIVITNKTPLTAKTFDRCPNMRYVGVLATGYNIVDTEAASKHNVVVTNIPAYGTAAVAQHVFALLLEAANRVGIHSKDVSDGKWSNCPDFCFVNGSLFELNQKTIGIIGFGRIGQEVARIATAFGMNVLYHSRRRLPELESDKITYSGQSGLYNKSDVISLHVPLSPTTEKMINTDSIGLMKDGVIIVNTSRGQLIDEDALAGALKSGKVSYAALDVLSSEPPNPNNPLLGLANTYITPHIAWAAFEARERLQKTALDNLIGFLAGKIQNKVN